MRELGSKQDFVDKLTYDFGEGHSTAIEFWARELTKLTRQEAVVEAARKYVEWDTSDEYGRLTEALAEYAKSEEASNE